MSVTSAYIECACNWKMVSLDRAHKRFLLNTVLDSCKDYSYRFMKKL